MIKNIKYSKEMLKVIKDEIHKFRERNLEIKSQIGLLLTERMTNSKAIVRLVKLYNPQVAGRLEFRLEQNIFVNEVLDELHKDESFFDEEIIKKNPMLVEHRPYIRKTEVEKNVEPGITTEDGRGADQAQNGSEQPQGEYPPNGKGLAPN